MQLCRSVGANIMHSCSKIFVLGLDSDVVQSKSDSSFWKLARSKFQLVLFDMPLTTLLNSIGTTSMPYFALKAASLARLRSVLFGWCYNLQYCSYVAYLHVQMT